jgi:hypothetical protein
VLTYDQAIANCVCQGSVCSAQCGSSLCAQQPVLPQSGDACDTCMKAALQPDAGAGCVQQVANACKANRDCTALVACATSSATCH